MYSQPSATNDMAIHLVEKSMHVNELIIIMYNSPSQDVFDHFKMVNAHIKNNRVEVGQVVLLSPADSKECTREEVIFLDVARQVDANLEKLSKQEKILLAQRYDLLSNVSNTSGAFLGIANTAWAAQIKQVERILKEIERLYLSTLNANGKLSNNRFFAQRRIQFQRLDAALMRFGHPVMNGTFAQGSVKNNLGLSSKSIVHSWKQGGGNTQHIPGFATHYKQVSKMAKVVKRTGYIGMALSVATAEANIRQACLAGENDVCRKSKYVERGGAAGSISGGMLGGAAGAYLTCNFIFGAPSAGTSLLWCSIVGGIAGGTALGMAFNKLGQDAGSGIENQLYRTKRPLQ